MTIQLNKITLDKTRGETRLGLGKGGGDSRVILRWKKYSGESTQKKGFLASLFGNKESSIDLDLGVCVEIANSEKYLIDPLQGGFQQGDRGSLTSAPFVLHSGDDRSGGGGEVLTISGANARSIRQLWLYTFIYEGAARWTETDAVVDLEVSGQPKVEIMMGQQASTKTFCALAHLVFHGGELEVKRLITFHDGHEDCDNRYGWGFQWQAGSK